MNLKYLIFFLNFLILKIQNSFFLLLKFKIFASFILITKIKKLIKLLKLFL